MNEPGLQVLLDQPTLRDRLATDAYPEWARAHYERFRETTLGERDGAPFPCHFGVQSERDGDALYTFVPSLTDPDALLAFRDVLVEYVDTFREFSERCSLVTFVAPDDASTEADYHERLWHLLQFLHVHDPEPWPADIPTDPDDPYWEFCLAGEPMFPTTRAPFYDDRASRYCPVGLEVTFQPRAIFEGITGDTEAGQRARTVIQERLEAYDGVCPHADLGDWGVEGDREWIQYMLSEDDAQFPDGCPLTISREHPKVDPAVDPVAAGRATPDPGSGSGRAVTDGGGQP
jgi:FPC/CPF motif-containing protein YcgG